MGDILWYRRVACGLANQAEDDEVDASGVSAVFTDDEWDYLGALNDWANGELHLRLPVTLQGITIVLPSLRKNEVLIKSILERVEMKQAQNIEFVDATEDSSREVSPDVRPSGKPCSPQRTDALAEAGAARHEQADDSDQEAEEGAPQKRKGHPTSPKGNAKK